METTGKKTDMFGLILGIVLIVLGVLVLLGQLNIPLLKEIVGILLIVVGIVMLVKKQNAILAVVVIVLGILMLASREFGSAVESVLTILIGVVLLLAGILKLLGKW